VRSRRRSPPGTRQSTNACNGYLAVPVFRSPFAALQVAGLHRAHQAVRLRRIDGAQTLGVRRWCSAIPREAQSQLSLGRISGLLAAGTKAEWASSQVYPRTRCKLLPAGGPPMPTNPAAPSTLIAPNSDWHRANDDLCRGEPEPLSPHPWPAPTRFRRQPVAPNVAPPTRSQ
jgi:hypothetical protein